MPLFWVLNKWSWIHYAGILSGVTSYAPCIRILSFFDSFVFWSSQNLSQCMFLREVGTWWLVKHFALTTYLIWSHIPPVSLWLTSNFRNARHGRLALHIWGFMVTMGRGRMGRFTYMHVINRLYLQNVWCDRSNLLPIDCCQSSYLFAQLQLRIMVWESQKCFYLFETWQLSYCWLPTCHPSYSINHMVYTSTRKVTPTWSSDLHVIHLSNMETGWNTPPSNPPTNRKPYNPWGFHHEGLQRTRAANQRRQRQRRRRCCGLDGPPV